MFDAPQRLSVVLEQHNTENDWTVVAILIDDRGQRKRSTLGRYPTRKIAAKQLTAIYELVQRSQTAAV